MHLRYPDSLYTELSIPLNVHRLMCIDLCLHLNIIICPDFSSCHIILTFADCKVVLYVSDP